MVNKELKELTEVMKTESRKKIMQGYKKLDDIEEQRHEIQSEINGHKNLIKSIEDLG